MASAKTRQTSSSTTDIPPHFDPVYPTGPVDEYAEKVIRGDIVAGPHVRNACRRHRDDRLNGPARVGVRFSYKHALYETGPVISVDGDIWEVPISPTVRELIPAGADLEFDRPTCLCRLSDDRGMDVVQDAISKNANPNVSFVEATDYWNRLALGLI